MTGQQLRRPGAAVTLALGAFSAAVETIQGVVEPMLRTNLALAREMNEAAGELARSSLQLPVSDRADDAPVLRTCVVTVLFTDISGFTSLAERIPAVETAAFIARYVRLIADRVADEGGTFDKFVGDSVMAYWGAPEAQADHAVRAWRAAHAIAATVRAENAILGRLPIRMRLGLHTGLVATGDIGAPGAGTAIFGDTVNTGQRIEQLAKSYFRSGDDVVGLASAEALRAAGRSGTAELRRHRLRGRSRPIEVARII